jgi:hypothetical protein
MIDGSKINDFTERTVTIDFTNEKAKTLLKLGYIRIYLENKFNWLQKKMFKFLLGIELLDLLKGDKE